MAMLNYQRVIRGNRDRDGLMRSRLFWKVQTRVASVIYEYLVNHKSNILSPRIAVQFCFFPAQIYEE